MQAFLILVLAVFSLNTTPNIPQEESHLQEPMTTYYVIRHAEKDTSNPKDRNPMLSQQGLERAKGWAQVFKAVNFDAIYSTDYHRTRQTAAPIAEGKNREVQIYNPAKPKDPAFIAKTRGKTVLVVGHSNTNPAFVNAFLGKPTYQDIDEAESGSLFIVTVTAEGKATAQLLFIN